MGVAGTILLMTGSAIVVSILITLGGITLFALEKPLAILTIAFACPALIGPFLVGGFILLCKELDLKGHALMATNKELEEALEKIKQLKGLLPICSYCKKIRDDKGYWSQIESYISIHSEAEFSHGMCPDCFKKIAADIKNLPPY